MTAKPLVPAGALWNSLSRTERVSALRFAQAGLRHPDVRVAAAATSYSEHPSWSKWWNTVPGWLLPLVGLLLGVAVVAMGIPVLAIPAGFVVVCGLMGWNSVRLAAVFRAVYVENRDHDAA